MELSSDWSDEEMETDTFLAHHSLTSLSSCTTVSQSFVAHGLAPDDKIDRREQVLMFRRVEKETERELKVLMEEGHFDRAKEVGGKLEGLREEFGGLQVSYCCFLFFFFEGAQGYGVADVFRCWSNSTSPLFSPVSFFSLFSLLSSCPQLKDEMDRQGKQKKLFAKATKIFNKQTSDRHSSHSSAVEASLSQTGRDLEKFCAIQRENLALELSRIEKPRMKYSKSRMELKTAEVRLSALKQYDDAKNVRRMLKSIDAREEANFDEVFDKKMQLKVDQLAEFQRDARARHKEKVSHVRWKEMRAREKEAKVGRTNLKNKTADMEHFMTCDGKMKPELTVKPSALLWKRAGFDQNSSKLRGEQLLDRVKGKKAGDSVFIESLCKIHDFDDKRLLNTSKYEQKIKYKGYETDFGKTFSARENRLQGLGGDANVVYD